MNRLTHLLEPVALGILLIGGLGLIISTFLGTADVVGTQMFGVPVPGAYACHPPERLAQAARALGVEAHPCPAAADALDAIARRHPGPSRVLVTGSLYLAGAVLAEEGGEAATGP